MKLTHFGTRLVCTVAFLVAAPVLFNTTPALASSTVHVVSAQNDQQIETELAQQFGKERFKDVQISVKDGLITLKGTVLLFADKDAAEKKALHAQRAIAIRNEIRVKGAEVSDQALQAKLVKKLEYDRVGYGTTAFNAISVNVRGGEVTLGGHAYGPMDKSSAFALASYTPGVQDVIDEIEVDPVSSMDDGIRLDVARRIYGYPALSRYAIDPGKPIRISVQNGRVTLYGVVDSQGDKDAAYIRANSAPGVFKVANELQIEGARSERN
jgi:hyperosmotically inducible protein